MPQRFDLTYTAADDAQHTPVMIHRALLGSIERFLGILIEHHAGDFPRLARPGAGAGAADRRPPRGLRRGCRRGAARAPACGPSVDERSESVGRKIRDAELAKVPYMLVVGDEEESGAGVAVRRHGEGDLGLMPLAELADRILSESPRASRYTRAR